MTSKCHKCDSELIEIIKDYNHFDVYVCRNCEYWTYGRIEECCRDPYKVITLSKKPNGQRFLYKQCLNCGGKRNAKALSFKNHSHKIYGDFDVLKFEKYLKGVEIERSRLREDKDYYNDNYSQYSKYRNYLNSDSWKKKRQLVLERDENICQECKEKPAEDVHHLTYENLENEKLSDLLSVCRECHIKIHREELRKYFEEKFKSRIAGSNN